MSLNIKDNYATVFDPIVHEKRVNANVSTGRKLKDQDENGNTVYVNSYWNATFVGNAYKKATSLSNKDRIHITSGIITHEKSNKVDDSGKNRYYYSVVIFDFEKLNDSKTDENFSDEDDNDLPF